MYIAILSNYSSAANNSQPDVLVDTLKILDNIKLHNSVHMHMLHDLDCLYIQMPNWLFSFPTAPQHANTSSLPYQITTIAINTCIATS